ncbi:hypothetical protein Patl1_36542 [Pistacia atlantica]|nr:hypothetical protein Patl1_36542 [Pistacia atlantica]
MRKVCVMKLFSRRRAESWASIHEEVDATVKTVMEENWAAFGSVSHEGQDEFVKIMQEFSKLFGAFNIADFFPWLGWIHAQEFNKRLARARESLDGFIDIIIDEHIEKKKNVNGEDEAADADMVDELMAFYNEDRDGTNNLITLTRDNIKAIIMDVMFGGTETVASAIEWAMAELMKSPEELQKVQEELADKVGLNRVVHESDLEKLTYLKCAIKETLLPSYRLSCPLTIV